MFAASVWREIDNEAARRTRVAIPAPSLKRFFDRAQADPECRDAWLKLATLGVLSSRKGFTPAEVARLHFARHQYLARPTYGPHPVETVREVVARLDGIDALPDPPDPLLGGFSPAERDGLRFRRWLVESGRI